MSIKTGTGNARGCRQCASTGPTRLNEKGTQGPMKPPPSRVRGSLVGATVLAALAAIASSHREAPFVSMMPKVDATDFYAFMSYEPGRDGYVTLVANYQPFQTNRYGGPNFFAMDPDARYDIRIDNNGDARADFVFRFAFKQLLKGIALDIGTPGHTKKVPVPLINVGPIGPAPGDVNFLNVEETYTVELYKPNFSGELGLPQTIKNAADGHRIFRRPVDNIGLKSIPDYENYSNAHIYNIKIPGTARLGRVFVGQRKDPFVVNLGETFDLINLSNPLGSPNGQPDSLAYSNVTSIVLEIPKEALLAGLNKPIIGAWTTASLPKLRLLSKIPTFDEPSLSLLEHVQVSRLGNPLVNEVVIGLEDKNKFNSSSPQTDGQFLDYVTHPTLPAIVEILFGSAGVKAPTKFPRTDLVAAFLTGVDGLNKTAVPAEYLRLNTSIAPKPMGSQARLGVIDGDVAGFPNGRRPGDDVVDIALRVVMGKLLPLADAPSGQLPFTDGAYVDDSFFKNEFPYLKAPLRGAPN